jgi:hypothetical protein
MTDTPNTDDIDIDAKPTGQLKPFHWVIEGAAVVLNKNQPDTEEEARRVLTQAVEGVKE